MSNSVETDYPAVVEHLSLKKLIECLSGFKSISPVAVFEMHKQILAFIHDDFKSNPERPEYNG